jgi:succinylarginine dihydrolase
MALREFNFDGLVGPTHNYAGLSPGNLAATKNEGRLSNPRAAALQGVGKMRFLHALGVGQAVLPPRERPSLRTLRSLGFQGSDEEVLAKVAREDDQLLRLCSSASSMWAANAAVVAPACDTRDGRTHFVPANLASMFHRAIEASETERVLRAIFADEQRFAVHAPLPSTAHFADEGAANHTRLHVADKAVHVFAWGRSTWASARAPSRYPARQTDSASRALARLLDLDPQRALLAQQHPEGIDRGAFHTDVLAVGHGELLLAHELAFEDLEGLSHALREALGPSFKLVLASGDELPAEDAVSAYPFNSMLVRLPSGEMAIIAPEESRENRAAKRFLDRVVAESNPVSAVHYIDVRESMDNGGGPACLRLRVPLEQADVAAVQAKVWIDDAQASALEAWITRNYRDRMQGADLRDAKLWREVMTALDELTTLLGLPAVYDFQR